MIIPWCRGGRDEHTGENRVKIGRRTCHTAKLASTYSASQVIPNQLMQGLIPTQEERRDWLWLSRLAFHLRRASASVLLLPNSEVVEEVCSAKAKKEVLEYSE